jgi:hypothetical protein
MRQAECAVRNRRHLNWRFRAIGHVALCGIDRLHQSETQSIITAGRMNVSASPLHANLAIRDTPHSGFRATVEVPAKGTSLSISPGESREFAGTLHCAVQHHPFRHRSGQKLRT